HGCPGRQGLLADSYRHTRADVQPADFSEADLETREGPRGWAFLRLSLMYFRSGALTLRSCWPYTRISVLSMSSTTHRGEATAYAFAINSRLSAARPARFSSCVRSSVSNDCKREVNAAPRSQILLEPMSRKVGSWERRSASLTSSYPANRLYTDCPGKLIRGNWVLLP